jgi:D-xylose transport system substrate-binding protein
VLAIAAAGMVMTATLAACSDSDGGSNDSGGAQIGVILPDSKSSQRWAKDATYFREAFAALKVPALVQAAGGDPERFVAIGDEMINSGVKVLIIANLDSLSGKAVLDRAGAEGIKTIDYDRLTLNGGADYYVSFDNERIGELQGYGLTKCLRLRNAVNPMVAELNGAPSDGNAIFLKNGYDFVLQGQYDSGAFRKGPDQFVPDWTAEQGRQVFEQMLKQQPKIDAVVAANDDIAGAVIDVLKKNKLNGRVPVTGQDATVEGLRNVLAGDQCLTIYKRYRSEAYTAASLGAKLYRGETPKVGGELKDPESGEFIPFADIPPVPIEAEQVKDVVAEGFVSKEELCEGDYQALCARYEVE